jgi:hypothetical protein
VVGQAGDGWQLLGASEWRGAGFDSPPSFYLRPDLLDFDADGQQEVLDRYFRVHRGSTVSADILYRWDGHALARIWRAKTVSDNRLADDRDVPQPYRQNYRAKWKWVDLDGDHLDDILLKERVTFHPFENPSWGGDEAVLGEEVWERAFRWDGEALRPSAPSGPAATFAYVAMGDVWLSSAFAIWRRMRVKSSTCRVSFRRCAGHPAGGWPTLWPAGRSSFSILRPGNKKRFPHHPWAPGLPVGGGLPTRGPATCMSMTFRWARNEPWLFRWAKGRNMLR